MKNTIIPTSIKIGHLKDEKSLKYKLAKKAKSKKISLHKHILDVLNIYG